MNALPKTTAAEGAAAPLRPRFCPSPTGVPHVGLARTALFAWAAARHAGGRLVFRIEDTDAARDSQESMDGIVEMLHFLGLDYDEGPDVGGPYAPYRQSERHDRHREVARLLVEKGYAYESFSTAEEVEARHQAAGRDPKLGYDGFDRDLTDEQKTAFRAEGRDPVIRFRMPDKDISFTDAVRGEVTFAAGMVPDYVIVRGNGVPLYTLVNPLDDADQKVNLVIRGEDLLSSTPRQIALWEAFIEMGIAERVPEYAHLPLVVGDDNKKLSKRDPRSSFFNQVERGLIREGLVNYLALLGWSIAADRDLFTPEELVEHFDIHDVNPNPAHWDQKKAEALNGDHIRALSLEDFSARLLEFLQDRTGFPKPATIGDIARLKMIAPLIQPRVNVLAEATPMVKPFFARDDELEIAEDARAALKDDAAQVLDAAIAALEPLDGSMPDIFKEPPTGWMAGPIEEALRAALVDGLGIKPKFAFGPLRTAISGQRVSPPLFESMEILGKEPTLRRLRNLRASLG